MNGERKPVEVCQDPDHAHSGLVLQIHGPATVQDLLDAWQPLCDDTTIYKHYATGNYASCRGCRLNCCSTAYVIPDLIAFKKIATLLGMNHAEFLSRCFQPEKMAAGLLRMRPDPCLFLTDNICTIYPVRALICRLYICTPLQGETEELIYKIAWIGAAATQVFAQAHGLLPSSAGAVSSFDRLFLDLLEQYRSHPGIDSFLAASDYADIPLDLFLP